MEDLDIRWRQRFNSFHKAFGQLERAVKLSNERALTELEEQGMIQAFEYTHELAWKMLKDFLEEKGNSELFGSKDTTRLAFKLEIIDNGEVWMDMIKSRNLTSHTYNEDTAQSIVSDIKERYFDEFQKLKLQFEEISS
jgi:nucleotidyltransferase substrate binding protein (TIGR01987 family)